MPKRQREDFIYKPGEAMPRDVTRVVIPGSVRVLPDRAFQDNRSLEEVVFEEGVVEVRQFAFFKCASLGHLRLPSTLHRIGRYAFLGCTSLKELSLPEGITEIGCQAFCSLSTLEHVRLPSTLNAIRTWAFSMCTSLREVIFPDGIRSIRTRAFCQCKSLENIVLPSTLNAIGRGAFSGCNSLRTVELRGGIQIILTNAFVGCDVLRHIRLPCKALVITGNEEGQHFTFARDGFTLQISKRNVVIASECFNSIRPAEISDIEIAIISIAGEEIMSSELSWSNSQYNEWDEICQRLRVLLAPHEKRHKAEIASLLELRLWKAEMEKLDDDSDSRARARTRARTRVAYRPQRGVEMIQDNVLSFLHFL